MAMNYRNYYRNSEALYTIGLVMYQFNDIKFGSRRGVGTYLRFQHGRYVYELNFSGYKHYMNEFYVLLNTPWFLTSIYCFMNKRDVMLV